MKDAADLRAELEADQLWRRDEIRFLHNQLANFAREEERDRFRRAVLLLLYAHFEGFCKFAFVAYVNSINELSIKCSDANFALVASTLDRLFYDLRNPEKKAVEFRNNAPDDTKLHRFARDREFVERVAEFDRRQVQIPDTVIDMESNLTPTVLRKNLYRLGFKYDLFSALEGKIHQLLNYRNNISHGASRSGIKETEYEDLQNAIFSIMDEISREIMNAFHGKTFLRSTSPPLATTGSV